MQNRALILDASFRINERRQTFKATLCRFFMSLHYLLWVSLVAGTNAECPLELNPQRVVVRYGSSVSVDCSTNITHKGIGWEASEGPVPTNRDQNLITWRVLSLRQWDIKPICYINYDGTQCESDLPITIYKTPESVSINTADHTGPMTNGSTYKLQCDVVNVAPVQNLTVKWYKGETLMHNETFNNSITTPVNTTSILQIIADRSDDGVQYRCEAELELGAEGPQPPPAVTSEPLNIVVYFKPIINDAKLPSTVSVFQGYPEVLVCEAEGKPKPEISWSDRNGNRLETADGNLTVFEFGDDDFYTCSANNSVNTTSRRVNLDIHENYLPIIVCIVVGIVVVILFISIFIYTTYYKNAKMGQYSPKNATTF
ncbi:putative hemicentin-2-like [Triplophysa rosa]|uniref:Hemicentin-2-like n=1 Tax=Triplophysa rosa TaxID=992332 RepID=A0A9W7WIK3_TRIRA|nr:putative hemicentin-2-like [Triplophysa rosa]